MFDYRKATLEDLELVVKARIEFMLDSRPEAPPEAFERLCPSLYDFMKTSIADESFIAWLAFDGSTLIATSGLSFLQHPPCTTNPTGKVAYISNMYTKPEYRGKGIATVLFDKTVEEAKRRGYIKLRLTTTDMGRPIYEKYGFIPEAGMVYIVA